MKKVIVILITLGMMLSSSMAFAEAPEGFDIAFDSLVFRPLGIAATLGGSAIFFVSLPIAAITDSIEPAAEMLVKEPYRFTFVRPLGEFRHLK
jgi:hypothetical protein